VKKIKAHSIVTFGTHLIIAGCLLGILFGQGTHLHAVAVHIGDHLDVHTVVHAHHSDDKGKHSHQKPNRDQAQNEHKHHVDSFDVNAIIAHPVKIFADTQFEYVEFPDNLRIPNADFVAEPAYIHDLPPPLITFADSYFSVFTFRGPPAA